MPRDKFDYTKWALESAAMCLQSDLSCGFDVADTSTPNGDKARAALQRLIHRLHREADRRASQGEVVNE